MYAERLPPHDIDAEEAVVGSILIDGESLTKVSSFLKPPDFYGEKGRSCYEACLTLFERGEALNQVTVAHELSLRDQLAAVGGTSYLSHLVTVLPTSVHIEYYARIVSRTSIMRQIIRAGGEIASIGYEGSPDEQAALNTAEGVLFGIRSGTASRDYVHIREILDAYMEESGAIQGPDARHLAPVPTGFVDLDKLLGGGMQRSDMIVLAARPGLGKSTLALNIARNAAMAGSVVGILSLEMGREQIGMRLLASEANVDSYRLRVGLLSEREERRLLDAIGMLSDLPIFVDDSSTPTPVEIRGKARRLQSERALDLLILDYMQLVDTGRRENRSQEIGELSRSLKALARDLDIPVIACSQLNRAVEHRPSHRPLLSDLRESGSIEQDADIVAFIHREDAYTTRDEWERRNPDQPYPENVAEIIIAKHRNGPQGVVRLDFRPNVVRFDSTSENPARSLELASHGEFA